MVLEVRDGQFLRARDDQCPDALAPLLVGNPDDCDLTHVAMVPEDTGDLARLDVLTAGEYRVVFPVQHPQSSRLVARADVAGPEAVLTEGRLGRPRVVVVARRHRRPGDDQFARVARGEDAPVVVHDGHLGPDERSPDRPREVEGVGRLCRGDL